MARTNIDIDDEACEQIMRRHRLRSKREAVNLALRSFAEAPLPGNHDSSLQRSGLGNDLDLKHATQLERLREATEMSAAEIVDLGLDLLEQHLSEQHRSRAAAVLSSAFVGCLPEAPSDLALNYRSYLAESFGDNTTHGQHCAG